MSDTELQSLCRKGLRICANFAKLEPMVAHYHAKFPKIEAAILAIDPQLRLPTRHHKANPMVAR